MKSFSLSFLLALAFTAQVSFSQQVSPAGIYGAANQTTVGNLSVNWVIGTLTPTSISALPVKLISFKGYLTAAGHAELEWKTAEEISNEGFEIQKSLDGKTFERIGWVDGSGDRDVEKTYRFTDQDLQTTSYYRLKQIDYDGKYFMSRIVSVVPAEESLERLAAYPNPTSNGRVQITLPKNTSELTIVDVRGKLITSQKNPPMGQTFKLPSTGMYLLRIQTKVGSNTVKIFNN
jgi:hypothetical protein